MYEARLKIPGNIFSYNGVPLQIHPIFQRDPTPTFIKQVLRKLKVMCKEEALNFQNILVQLNFPKTINISQIQTEICLRSLFKIDHDHHQISFINQLFLGNVKSTHGKSNTDKLIIIQSFINAALKEHSIENKESLDPYELEDMLALVAN